MPLYPYQNGPTQPTTTNLRSPIRKISTRLRAKMSSAQPSMPAEHRTGPFLIRMVVVAEYTHVILLLFGLFVSGLLDIMVPPILVRIMSFVVSGLGIGALILLGKGTEERRSALLIPYIFWRLIVTGLLITALLVNAILLHKPACDHSPNLCNLANANLANYSVLIVLGFSFTAIVCAYAIKFARARHKEATPSRATHHPHHDNYLALPQHELQETANSRLMVESITSNTPPV